MLEAEGIRLIDKVPRMGQAERRPPSSIRRKHTAF
jgi:hypothetical protein